MTGASAGVPAHLVVPGTEGHGVTLLANQIATATGARVVCDDEQAARLPGVHVHVTDRLFGTSPEAAAGRLAQLGGRTRMTVTLHDVPQATDGTGFQRRRRAYAEVLRAAAGWVVCSDVERATVLRHCAPGAVHGAVIHLPVVPGRAETTWSPPRPGDQPVVAVVGWVYPGKGHAEALQAAAQLGASGSTRPRVVALGAAADGHADLVRNLHRMAARLGVHFACTGWLTVEDLARGLAGSSVGLSGHTNVSASGSLNCWLAVGHRPLVRDSAYARELAGLRPGTLEIYAADGGPDVLARHLAARLAHPEQGRLPMPVADLHPTLAEVASAYRAWWAG